AGPERVAAYDGKDVDELRSCETRRNAKDGVYSAEDPEKRDLFGVQATGAHLDYRDDDQQRCQDREEQRRVGSVGERLTRCLDLAEEEWIQERDRTHCRNSREQGTRRECGQLHAVPPSASKASSTVSTEGSSNTLFIWDENS